MPSLFYADRLMQLTGFFCTAAAYSYETRTAATASADIRSYLYTATTYGRATASDTPYSVDVLDTYATWGTLICHAAAMVQIRPHYRGLQRLQWTLACDIHLPL